MASISLERSIEESYKIEDEIYILFECKSYKLIRKNALKKIFKYDKIDLMNINK